MEAVPSNQPTYDQMPRILRELRDRAGMTMDQMAKALGYKGPSSYQRYEEENGPKKGLPTSLVHKFAKAVFGKGDPPITVEDLLPLLTAKLDMEMPNKRALAFHMLGLEPPPLSEQDTVGPELPVREIAVLGETRASFWMSTPPSQDVPLEYLPIPALTGFPASEQYAVKVRGPSMNKIIKDGTYAICVRYSSGKARMTHGKVVHVQRQRRGETEWTLKRLRWDGGNAMLWPESDDPAYSEPIPLSGGDPDTVVEVVGVVEGYFIKADDVG